MSRKPGECPDEGAVVDIGGGKSFCKAWNTWTNCREVAHCVFESVKKSSSAQTDIFELLEDWSCEDEILDCE